MARQLQSHFVVYYDHVSKKWEIDEATTNAVFDNLPIFDNDSNTWLSFSDLSNVERDVDEDAAEKLKQILHTL